MRNRKTSRQFTFVVCLVLFAFSVTAGAAYAADQPNIVVIWGDDIGQSNISAYTHGLMGYHHAWVMYPLGDVVGAFLQTFKEFPPRQKAGSWDMAKVLESLQTPISK